MAAHDYRWRQRETEDSLSPTLQEPFKIKRLIKVSVCDRQTDWTRIGLKTWCGVNRWDESVMKKLSFCRSGPEGMMTNRQRRLLTSATFWKKTDSNDNSVSFITYQQWECVFCFYEYFMSWHLCVRASSRAALWEPGISPGWTQFYSPDRSSSFSELWVNLLIIDVLNIHNS